jgi:hypothetical protein
VTNIVFAYAGHIPFSFISESGNLREFSKALFLLQATDVSVYVVVAIVMYRYTGQEVTSSALGSANKVVMKVAYGIALPTVSCLCRLLHVGRLLNVLAPAGGRHIWPFGR